MLGATPQCDFIPLRTTDLEGRGADIQEITDQDEVTQRQWAKGCFCRPLIWTMCSATALITTKRLMFTHGYHYPLTIAFRSFGAALVVYTILLRVASETNHISGGISQWGLRKLTGSDLLVNKYWAFMLPAALAAAASFPMLLVGLLHMPSLPVIVMLFPLAYAAESIVLFLLCSPSRSQKWLPWEAILAVVASSVILYNEYRLMVHGLIWGATGILLMGLSRACFVIGIERSGPEIAVQARLKASHGFVIMTLVFGLLFSGFGIYQKEHIHHMHELDSHTIALMVVNIASIVGTAFSGTSVMTFTPISFNDPQLQFSNIPLPPTELLASLTSNFLVGIASIYWHPTYVSWVQVVAYLIATAWLVGDEQIHAFILHCMDNTQQQFNSKYGKEFSEPRKPSRILTSSSLLITIFFLSLFLSSLSSVSIYSMPLGLPTSFDLSYKPQSKFDIVISMYQESPTSVKSMVERIKSTAYLSALSDVSVIIYTKDPASDLHILKRETGADIVSRLPNTGREGGTYLHHIVSNWDSLAEKTMFIQAHPHNIRELIPRINDYLVPQTGMLSLGFTGVTCQCGSCSDRWGWEDKWAVVPTLYEKIYGAPCDSNQEITLSYKGQFIASAARIRGIGKKNYKNLLDAITSRDGWAHNATMLALGGNGDEGGMDEVGEGDSPSNPYFGFTVERIWGLLIQCGTDKAVAARCPSLLSGMGRGDDVGDCQCLDEAG
ncbi:uncharacterized protein PAC_18417 [Phialocephala subalpina]|uniref:Uncharacterized protein n=1 Tax=Phialocephala subalpina TaxID=576137 RepID=A0A1L7XU34_9HELO|nr:uncharacterized protein PAC_18417 [Phialocephala subalpina]